MLLLLGLSQHTEIDKPPYNFLQYYELYTSMPKNLHPKIESMPKQAIYSLASRTASTHKKRSFIEKCQKQNKQEILQLIRDQFPLAEYDKRQPNHYNTLVNLLNRVHLTLNQKKHTLTQKNKQTLQNLLNQIQQTVKK